MTRWIGTRIHVVVAVIAAALTFGAAPQIAASSGPPIFVGGFEVPTSLDQLVGTGISSPATDSLGNLYFVYNRAGVDVHILKATPAGAVSVYVGNGQIGFSGDGGQATAAQVNVPSKLTFDASNNLYFKDDARIRKVTPLGVITTIAGNGTSGAPLGGNGDAGPATAAALGNVADIATDGLGNVYFTESAFFISGLVRKISSSGILSNVVGSTTFNGLAPILCSNLTPSATGALFNSVGALTTDSSNNVYATIVCGPSPTESRVLKITPAGVSSVFAGGGVGAPIDANAATSASFSSITNLSRGPADDIYLTNGITGQLLKVNQAGVMSLITSAPVTCLIADGTTAANLCVTEFATLASGQVYVIATNGFGNNVLGLLSAGIFALLSASLPVADGAVATHVPMPTMSALAAQPDGTLFYAAGAFANVRSITPAGNLGTKAGNGTIATTTYGGAATATSVYGIYGMHVDSAGNLYLVNRLAPGVDKVAANGTLQHFAGDGTFGNGPDGGQAASTPINPVAVTSDAGGNVFIAGRSTVTCGVPPNTNVCFFNVVRKVDNLGAISTVYSAPGGLLADLAMAPGGSIVLSEATTAAQLLRLDPGTQTTTPISFPGYSGSGHVVVDPAGSIFVSDLSSILKMTPDGTISTIDSLGANLGVQAQLPPSLAIDGEGNLYATGAERILKYPGVAAPDVAHTLFAIDDSTYVIKNVATDIDVKANDVDLLSLVALLGSPTVTVLPSPLLPLHGVASVGGGRIRYAPNVDYVGPDSLTYSVCDTVAVSSCDTATVTIKVLDQSAGTTASTVVAGVPIVPTPAADPANGATATQVSLPPLVGLASDQSGQLFFSMESYFKVHLISAGLIGTKAGNGVRGFAGLGGPRLNASVPGSTRLHVSSTGELYVVGANQVTKVDSSGNLVLVAGDGTPGYVTPGPSTPATSIGMQPVAVTTTPTGEVYIAANRFIKYEVGLILKVDLSGNISEVFTTPITQFGDVAVTDVALGPDGTLVVATTGGNFGLLHVNPATHASTTIPFPPGLGQDAQVAVDPVGNIFVATRTAVSKIALNGLVIQIDPTFSKKVDIAIDGQQNLYVLRDDRIVKYAANAALPVVVAAVHDAVAVPAGGSVDINVRANDTVSTSFLTNPAVTSAPAHGTTSVLGTGLIRYTPTVGTFGIDTFSYTVCSFAASLVCGTATVTVVVVAPTVIARADVATLTAGSSVDIAVQSNDTVSAGALRLPTVVTAPAHGSAAPLLSGHILYTPSVGYSGPDSFVYADCATLTPSVCVQAAVNITVNTLQMVAPLAPVRLFDTRTSEPQGAITINKQKYGGAGNILKVKITGTANVPTTGVGAVSLNVTVVDPIGSGFVTVFPCGTQPTASNLNYTIGQVIPNAVIAPVSPTGEVCFFSSVDTDLIADVNGWFST